MCSQSPYTIPNNHAYCLHVLKFELVLVTDSLLLTDLSPLFVSATFPLSLPSFPLRRKAGKVLSFTVKKQTFLTATYVTRGDYPSLSLRKFSNYLSQY